MLDVRPKKMYKSFFKQFHFWIRIVDKKSFANIVEQYWLNILKKERIEFLGIFFWKKFEKTLSKYQYRISLKKAYS